MASTGDEGIPFRKLQDRGQDGKALQKKKRFNELGIEEMHSFLPCSLKTRR
jgi:hypothetical protein